MLMKLTKGRLADYTVIAAMLSFSLGIALANFGEYPLNESVTGGNLMATIMYIVFWALLIYLASLFKRRRILLFCRIFQTVSLLFMLWFVAATVSSTVFIPSSLSHTFSMLTIALNNPYIGLYFFMSPSATHLYACLSFICVLLLSAACWIIWLYDVGYFKRLKEAIDARPRRKKKVDILKEEILEIRKQKEEQKKAPHREKED